MGNPLDIVLTCPNCKKQIQPIGKALTLALSCPACGNYYYTFQEGHEKFINQYKPDLAINSRGLIKGHYYQVLGFAVKRERRYQYSWREYFLFNPNVGIAFLSESDGNWNFLKPYAKHPLFYVEVEQPEVRGEKFSLYSKYRAEVLYACGEFFTDVIASTESSTHFEHIHPPRILHFEDGAKQLGAYLGEYIAPEEVAAAFALPVSSLPKKNGFGYTQPLSLPFDEKVLLVVTMLSLALAFLVTIGFNETSYNKNVFQKQFYGKDLQGQKMLTTPSFELAGEEKNVAIKIWAGVENDWFFAEYALVNEKTSEEFVFTNEIEYYHGIEGGESWSEGGNFSEAFLSSVPGGRYHINIYPEFGNTTNEFHIAVYRDIPFFSNFWIFFFALCLFPGAVFAYKHYWEAKRWKDSDYSPYHSE